MLTYHAGWILPLFAAYFHILFYFVGWWKDSMDSLEEKETMFIRSLL